MQGIDGKVALVTGAGSGIGREIALRFAGEGARVAVADVAEDGGHETVRRIEAADGEAHFFGSDVSDEDEVMLLIESVVDRFGGLDVAANNAGIEGEGGPIVDQTVESWDRVIDVNLRGVFLGMKHEIPHLLERGGGAIVNTASVAGLVGGRDLAPYYASKHGVVGLTRCAALEYADQGVRVNAVCPGVIDTPMIERFTGGDEEAQAGLVAMEPIGRMADPSEVAAAVVWLCSDDASYVTGVPMPVDGAMIAQ